jgi:vacuolar-type H+-ATPase subunit F/Vma7
MRPPIYIGDEVSAAGFALAGCRTFVVTVADSAAAALRAAIGEAPLILIGARAAAAMPPADLQAALSACAPLALVVPDLATGTQPPDLAAELRRRMGMEG